MPARPIPPPLSDAEWAEFLFMRANPKGLHRERWVHSHGCRRWFNVERDTVTTRSRGVYPIGGGHGIRRADRSPKPQPPRRRGAGHEQG